MNRTLRIMFNLIFRRATIDAGRAAMQPDPVKVNLAFGAHPAFVEAVNAITKYWIDKKLVNWFSIELFDPATLSTYFLIIQKAGRVTPEQAAVSYADALREIVHSEPAKAQEIARAVLGKYDVPLEDR